MIRKGALRWVSNSETSFSFETTKTTSSGSKDELQLHSLLRSPPRILWTKRYKRGSTFCLNLVLLAGEVLTLLLMLSSQQSILPPHLSEDYFALCPSPISHFSLAMQKEFIRLLVLHPGLSQHHSPCSLFPIFGLLRIWLALQLKQLQNTHLSPPTFSTSMEFLALTFYFTPLFTFRAFSFHDISFPLPEVTLTHWQHSCHSTHHYSARHLHTYMFTVSHLLQVHCGILPHTSSCRCCLVWV